MEGARLVTTDWTITSWQELAIVVTIVAALAGVTGGIIKSRLDSKNAEQASSDRLIRLIEEEADKRVEVVRTEFKLQIAEMQLEHQKQMNTMRQDFEKQLKALRKEHDTYRCELAPICTWRNAKVPPPPRKTSSQV